MIKEVSKIIFGTAAFSGKGGGYGFGKIDHSTIESLFNLAIEKGINTFDTAPIYGFNESEKVIGRLIKNRREKAFIISKSGVSWHSSKRVNMSNDPILTQRMLEQSLKNLQSDYIDLYMIHWPDPKIDIRYSLEILHKAQSQEKIRYIGLCNTNKEDLEKALENFPISHLQSEFNYFRNGFEEINSQIRKYGLKTMGYGTLDKGILTGSVTLSREFDTYDCRSWAPWWKKSNWKKRVIESEKIIEKLKGKSIDLGSFWGKYTLSNGLDSAIIGFNRLKYLENFDLRKIDSKIINDL